ncbi:D-amino-acid transaminase [Tepidicaulis sp. LMO-SS28]|uniref:D-amino-acid transaminase n=1 Tax=Tepidicaulis sp. LMO-SS28 TaxID=3447455 RepID=UPI003EDFA2EF
MPRIAYVNGRYVPHDRASVHVEDRGYQFADGVYEVAGLRDGRFMDMTRHLARLERSLAELEITPPVSMPVLRHIIRETVRRNRLFTGYVYLQVTRGVAPRDHAFPADTKGALVVTAKRIDAAKTTRLVETGIQVISVPDQRWGRRDIKSVSLLPNVLAKQAARAAGCYEAWQVEAGHVTEGASTNAWIVNKEGHLVTHPADHSILNGITRQVLIEAARQDGLHVDERPFTLEEAHAASEAFSTSSSAILLPVIAIDGKPIGTGRPGPVARRLHALYDAVAEFSS